MIFARDIDPTFYAEIQKEIWYPVVFVWVAWPDTEARVNSSRHDITWGGYTWTGLGRHGGKISHPGEGRSLAAEKAILTIFGPTDELLDAQIRQIRNREAATYIGATTTRGGAILVGVPYETFYGYVDAVRFSVQYEGETTRREALQLTVASGPPARAVSDLYHSDEDQRQTDPTDSAGRHLFEVLRKVSGLPR